MKNAYDLGLYENSKTRVEKVSIWTCPGACKVLTRGGYLAYYSLARLNETTFEPSSSLKIAHDYKRIRECSRAVKWDGL